MLTNKTLSIDIGNRYTKIIEGVKKGKKTKIYRAYIIDTPLNSFHDGIIKDINLIKDEIHNFIKREKIRTDKVVFTSQSSNIISRILTIPMAKPKEMDSLVKYEMEQYLPIDFNDYVVEFKMLEQFKEEEVLKARVRAVVYPRIMAEAYLELAKELKLTPVALDLNSNSSSKVLNLSDINSGGDFNLERSTAFIDMGYDGLNLIVMLNKNVEFTRLITSGGSHIDIDIASQLGVDFIEAEKMKHKYCDLITNRYENEDIEMVNRVIKVSVDEWARSIYKMIEYYNSSNKENTIDKIYIFGGSSRLKGIEGYMSSQLGSFVHKIKELEVIDMAESIMDKNIDIYINSIGALIRN